MTTTDDTADLGTDTALKMRLAALSPAAAHTLGNGIAHHCSDLRVSRAIAAALQDRQLTPEVRVEVARLAQQAAARMDPATPDATREKRIVIRVNDWELDVLASNAAARNMDTSDYLRQLGLGAITAG